VDTSFKSHSDWFLRIGVFRNQGDAHLLQSPPDLFCRIRSPLGPLAKHAATAARLQQLTGFCFPNFTAASATNFDSRARIHAVLGQDLDSTIEQLGFQFGEVDSVFVETLLNAAPSATNSLGKNIRKAEFAFVTA
jgi:hypothetical protein